MWCCFLITQKAFSNIDWHAPIFIFRHFCGFGESQLGGKLQNKKKGADSMSQFKWSCLKQSGTIREIVSCWKKVALFKPLRVRLCDFTDNCSIKQTTSICGVQLKPLTVRSCNEWISEQTGTEASLSWSYGCEEGHVKEKSQKEPFAKLEHFILTNR